MPLAGAWGFLGWVSVVVAAVVVVKQRGPLFLAFLFLGGERNNKQGGREE
jgi:hypothetical protein